MKKIKNLSTALQENILTLLVTNTEALPLLVNSVDFSMFDSVIYRTIAEKAITFYEQFKLAINQHLPDEFEDILKDKSEKSKASLYKTTILNIFENANKVNVDYTLKNLNIFIKRQLLSKTIIKVAEAVTAENFDKADELLTNYQNQEIKTFDCGLRFTDTKRVLKFLETQKDVFYTGIKCLDKFRVSPARKELFVLAGLSNRGKSWFLIHLGKQLLKANKKILHVTLEMQEERVSERYMQACFAYSKRFDVANVAEFTKDHLNNLDSIEFREQEPKGCFIEKNVQRNLESKLKKHEKKFKNLIAVEFPTGSLTVKGLKAYLETLIVAEKFLPDILLLDEPDLMKYDSKNTRTELGRIYREIRGIASLYNMAIVVVCQLNRAGVGETWLNEANISEDFSKFRTADNVLTYNQTDSEYKLSLGRLSLIKSRNDIKHLKILLAQSYATGQFCLDDALINEEYFKTDIGEEKEEPKTEKKETVKVEKSKKDKK